MTEWALMIAQLAVMAGLTGWMFTGVRDNWMYPRLNEAAVAHVVQFAFMAEQFPDEYAPVKHRKVGSPGVVRAMYYAIVLWETVALVLLALGTGALALALMDLVGGDTARGLAILGATAFTVNWFGFLVGGNHYCYWYCHQGSQHTHFALLLSGILTILLLALGGAAA